MTTGLLIALALQTMPPWTGVHWLSPIGIETADYQCDIGRVQLQIDRLSSVDGRVRLSEWSVGGNNISAERLDAWNDRLSRLTFYQGFSVTCRGDWIAIGVAGFQFDPSSQTSSPTKVSVIWGRDEAWFTDSAGSSESF